VAMKGRRWAEVATAAGVPVDVLGRVAAGDRWVTLPEVGALEEVLACELLPRWPRGVRGDRE
jgi:hypothetical protein